MIVIIFALYKRYQSSNLIIKGRGKCSAKNFRYNAQRRACFESYTKNRGLEPAIILHS